MTREYIRNQGYELARAGKTGVLVVVPTAAKCLQIDISKMSSVQEYVWKARESEYPIHVSLEAGLYFSFVRVEKLCEWKKASEFADRASKVDTVEILVL